MYTKFDNNPSRGFWVIALTPLRAAGGGRLRRKTITSPDPSDTGDIIMRKIMMSEVAIWRRQIHFYQINLQYFYSIFISVCTQGLFWQLPITGLCNGLVSNRRQTWSTDEPVRWLVYIIYVTRPQWNDQNSIRSFQLSISSVANNVATSLQISLRRIVSLT